MRAEGSRGSRQLEVLGRVSGIFCVGGDVPAYRRADEASPVGPSRA